MPIETRIDGDPESCRRAGSWLTDTVSGAVHDCGSQIHRARSDSEWGWGGDAGPAFRTRMSTAGQEADALGTDASAVGQAFRTFGDDLAGAQIAMARARDIALEAGLTVTGTVIHEPVAPAGGTGAPVVAPAGAPMYAQQVTAYSNAFTEAEIARGRLVQGQDTLSRVINDVWGKRYITTFDAVTSAFTAYGKNAQYWSAASEMYRTQARINQGHLDAVNRAADRGAYAGRPRELYRLQDYLRGQVRDWTAGAEERARRIAPNRLAVAAQGLRRVVTDASASVLPRTAGVARHVLGKVPVAGFLVTGAGVGLDISQGKPPGKAIVGGLAGMGAGMGVALGVAAFGGPVGWAVGGAIVAGIGVGYAAEWAYDEFVPEGAKDFIDDTATTIGRTVADTASKAWNAVF